MIKRKRVKKFEITATKKPTKKKEDKDRYLFPDCKGPLKEDCWSCEKVRICYKTKMYQYSRIPKLITENYIDKCSGSAWKIFTYINSTANFKRDSKYYGKCWLTYTQINKATGIKVRNMGKYINELADMGLIESKWSRMGGKEGVATIHIFTITWLLKLDQIKNRMPEEDPDHPDDEQEEFE